MKLFINTCFDTVMIGLVLDDKLISFKSWKADREESKKLTPNIAEMITEIGKTKDDIQAVYVVTGPGSFTAVRIGFIVGKAFAASLKCNLYSCNSFEFLSGLYEDRYEFLDLKAGGGKVYKIKLKDSSYELSDPGNNVSVSELNLENNFQDLWKNVLDRMKLVEDLGSLEPNYIKAPNITIPKG